MAVSSPLAGSKGRTARQRSQQQVQGQGQQQREERCVEHGRLPRAARLSAGLVQRRGQGHHPADEDGRLPLDRGVGLAHGHAIALGEQLEVMDERFHAHADL